MRKQGKKLEDLINEKLPKLNKNPRKKTENWLLCLFTCERSKTSKTLARKIERKT